MKHKKFRIWDSVENDGFIYFNILNAEMKLSGYLEDEYVLENTEQYTGLKDRNGKEAYKSDLAKVKVGGFEYTREIYQAESGAWVINIPVIGDVSTDGVPIILYGQEFEIIGNIHKDTPS